MILTVKRSTTAAIPRCWAESRCPSRFPLEGGWGQSVHWQGRGYEGSVEKPTWLAACIIRMLSTRDANTVEHFHSEFEHHAEAMADPYHSPNLICAIINVQNNAEIKDSVMSCEWQSPDPWWPTMEAEMYAAATGYPMTAEELHAAACRSSCCCALF